MASSATILNLMVRCHFASADRENHANEYDQDDDYVLDVLDADLTKKQMALRMMLEDVGISPMFIAEALLG